MKNYAVNVDSKSPNFDVIYYKSSFISTISSPAWQPLISRVPEIQHYLQSKTIYLMELLNRYLFLKRLRMKTKILKYIDLCLDILYGFCQFIRG